ncbi:hypothetical protein [Nocardia nova]|uniref:hypothetical protein n=1 Tax=Nocardia nova TaxID=37330 RepID=UPI003400C901
MASADEQTPAEDEHTSGKPYGTTRTVGVRVSTLIFAAVSVVLFAAAATFAVLWGLARVDLGERDAAAADGHRAEQVATDYARGASTVDYRDFDAWAGKLEAGTAPELTAKFAATAPKLRDLLTPLRWTSTSKPVAAKVMSDTGGVYVVNVFLTVDSTSVQVPGGGTTTVTYKVTVDRNSGWKITDVGSDDSPVTGAAK